MDELQHIVQLCLHRLTPKDMCMLRCTCLGVRDMSVSWRDHSIDFNLDGSASAASWLQNNIVSMQKLSLGISFDAPRKMLQDVMEGGGSLTYLCIKSDHITVLPYLPPKLQQLNVGDCYNLRELPALPPTLSQLLCAECGIEMLPSSLCKTAVTKLSCSGCDVLRSLPELPPSLVELNVNNCSRLLWLPLLPEGLKRLETRRCEELSELPALPTSLIHLDCSESAVTLPKLVHTGITELLIRDVLLLGEEELPDMPDSLENLLADYVEGLTRLPRVPTETLKQLRIYGSSIEELPGSLPRLTELQCGGTPIRQLPSLPSCLWLHLQNCVQLQHLPEQMPASLIHLD